jgi:uncharacterized C2H2 Zn-finger protein
VPDSTESDGTDHITSRESKKPRHWCACAISGCKSTFSRKSDLQRHVVTKHSGSQNRHQCPFCCTCYSRADNLNAHITEMHGRRNFVDLTPMDASDRRLLACPFQKNNPAAYREHRSACIGPGFPSFARMREHLKRVHMAKSKCPKCGSLFDKQEALIEHMQQTSQTSHMPIERSKGVTPEQEEEWEKLISKSMDEVEKWNTVYKVLFQCSSQSLPSPFQEPLVTQADLDQELKGLRSHLQSFLPCRVRNSLTQYCTAYSSFWDGLSSVISSALEDEMNAYLSGRKKERTQEDERQDRVLMDNAQTSPDCSQDAFFQPHPALAQSLASDFSFAPSSQSIASSSSEDSLIVLGTEPSPVEENYYWQNFTFNQHIDPDVLQPTVTPPMVAFQARPSQIELNTLTELKGLVQPHGPLQTQVGNNNLNGFKCDILSKPIVNHFDFAFLQPYQELLYDDFSFSPHT